MTQARIAVWLSACTNNVLRGSISLKEFVDGLLKLRSEMVLLEAGPCFCDIVTAHCCSHRKAASISESNMPRRRECERCARHGLAEK